MLKKYSDGGELFIKLLDVCNLNELRDGINEHKLHPSFIFVDINLDYQENLDDLLEVTNYFSFSCICVISEFNHKMAINKILDSGANLVIDKNLDQDAMFKVILKSYKSLKIGQKSIYRSERKREKIIFTERELSFLKLCYSELTYKEIAIQMNVSFSTVNNYREALFYKLGIKNRVGLVLFAINYLIINPYQISRK
jgi:DNA-binding NarL/FixJ family response regulator